MAQQALLDAIDREITKLQQVRSMLEGGDADGAESEVRSAEPRPAAAKRAGRPRGTEWQMSEEARARIGAAQRKRWAKQNGTSEEATAE